MILQEKNIHMVKVYDNIIPDRFCQALINYFESNEKNQLFIDEDYCPCFTEFNLNNISKKIVNSLIPYTHKVYQKYKEDTKSKYIPPFEELENFRIKRYLTNGKERFDEHVDVTDDDSSVRSLSFLFYLNSNDGNTLFPLHDLNIEPITGRVVVFPPTWEYPHQGLPPKSNPKYIMSTYLHYGED